MAQEKYLTPKEILGYLCDLEKKLPPYEYKIYVPSNNQDHEEVTIDELNNECQRMLEFVNMKQYKADVKFVELENDVAGNTIPGDTVGSIIHINVSSNLINNRKAVFATLAHEICHQVIYLYGIRPNIGWIIETYTDLCTIYVGFGQLILDGYNTDVGGLNRTLGYLKWNTYETTNHLVNVICGGVNSKNTGLEGCDVFADEAIELWEKEISITDFIKKEFSRQSSRLADPLRKIEYLENLLSIYRGYLKPEVEKLSKSFASKLAVISDNRHKLTAFNALYNTYCDSISEIKEINDNILDAALYNLYMDVKEKYNRVDFNREIICPCCGKRFKMNTNEGVKTIKCSSCETYFVVDTNEWTPTTIQRKMELKRIEKRQKQEEELEGLRLKVRSEERSGAWQESERLKNELRNVKEEIEELPSIVRWIVKKRVKINLNEV
jgi:hypothetical protein